MKNELPLSTEHRLLCYGDDSFNDAIAFSEEYISETLAVISDISFNGVKIDNLETSQKECENILLEVKNGDIYGYANLYCHPLGAFIYVFVTAPTTAITENRRKHNERV